MHICEIFWLLINKVNLMSEQGGELKHHSLLAASSYIHNTSWVMTSVTPVSVRLSVFRSSPPSCCFSVLSWSCTDAPWCFSGWVPRYRAGASGKGRHSSRPPSAASTPHRNRAAALVWLLETMLTRVSQNKQCLSDWLTRQNTASDWLTGSTKAWWEQRPEYSWCWIHHYELFAKLDWRSRVTAECNHVISFQATVSTMKPSWDI